MLQLTSKLVTVKYRKFESWTCLSILIKPGVRASIIGKLVVR